jgi:hypothetical protein
VAGAKRTVWSRLPVILILRTFLSLPWPLSQTEISNGNLRVRVTTKIQTEPMVHPTSKQIFDFAATTLS